MDTALLVHMLSSHGKQISNDSVLLLEKIADVLETIAQIIPRYQQIYDICKRNGSECLGKTEDHHLATLLSYMYADIIQLFLELYRVFCRGAQGTSVDRMNIVQIGWAAVTYYVIRCVSEP
jgi:hypothetical protein